MTGKIPTEIFRILQNGNCPLCQLFQALSASRREELGRILLLVSIKAGQVVVADGEVAPHIGCVIEGILAMTKALPDGRKHIIGLLNPMEIYGRIFDGASTYQIEALTDATVLHFDRRTFERLLLEAPEIERLFVANVMDELDAAREWILLIGRRKVIERVAAFVLMLSRHKVQQAGPGLIDPKAPLTVHIAIRRVDLAHYLGTRPESISRAFHALEKRGMVKIVDPNNFEILDWHALNKIVGHAPTTGTPAPAS